MLSILHFALAGLLAGSTFAQSNAGLPKCAADYCVTSDYGGCESLNVECICTQGDWIKGLACCVSAACDSDGQEATIEFANAICGSVGAADALPTTATCAAGQTPSFKSGAPTPSSTATKTAASSGSSSVTSAPASASSGSSSDSTSSTDSSSTTTDSASSGSATSAASTAASTTAGGSGAYSNQAQGAGLVLGLVGFLAAL